MDREIDDMPIYSSEILIVDDNSANLKLLVDILSVAGHKVRPANNATLALRSIGAKLPDLIILDIRMPGIDGFELCKTIKSDEKTKNIPLIFISVSNDEQEKVKGFQLGAVDYITKPFNDQEVLARVKTHLTIHQVNRELELSNEKLEKEISERIRAKAALTLSEARFANAFEFAPIGLAIVALNGQWVKVNQSTCKILDYTERELISMNFQDITHPDDLEGELIKVQKMIDGEIQTYQIQKRFIHKTGHLIWVSLSVSLLRMDTGEPLYFITQIQDITEEKELENTYLFLIESRWINNTNEDFFQSLAKYLANTLEVNYVSINRLNDDKLTAQTLSIYFNGNFQDNYSYAIKDTPSEEVLKNKVCCFTKYVRFLFPNDKVIQSMEAESFLGTTIWSLSGKPLGLITIVGRKELPNPHLATSILNLVAIRTASEFESKQAEEELRKSEEKFRTFFESNSAAIAIIEPDTTISMVNDAYCQLGGYSKEEVTGTSWTKQIPPQDLDRLKEYNRRRLENPKDAPSKYEFTFYHKNGEIKHGLMSVSMIESSRKIISSFTDITERKKAEEALAISEEKYRLLAANVNDVIWKLDINTLRFTYISPSIFKLRGLTVEEAMAETIEQAVIPEDVAEIKESLQKRVKKYYEGTLKSNVEKTLFRQPCKDGRIIWVEVLTSLIFDSNGMITEIIGTSRDVTDRKKAEEKLKQLSIATEQSPASIILTNINGDIEYVNPKFTDLTGYSLEEVQGKNPRILKSGNTSTAEYKKLWETILSGKAWHGELQNRKKNNEIYYEIAIISPITDDAGHVTHFLAVKEDITERKLASMQLEKYAEELKELNASKDKFFSIISHDLKSPFHSILGLLELMEEETNELGNEKIDFCMQSIVSVTKETYSLLENLLIWARSQSKKIEFNPEPFDLNESISEIVSLVKYQADNKKITITTKNLTKTIVKGEKNLINTVLRNLLSNAIKFSHPNGYVEVGLVQHSDSAEVYVQDNGVGIANESISSLFRLDSKLSTTGTENESGTGLGLILCKEFVEKHGGKIWVESEINKGSIFTFSLPKIL